MTGFLIAISVLFLIYFAMGVATELYSLKMRDKEFKFDKETFSRIIKWPKQILGG